MICLCLLAPTTTFSYSANQVTFITAPRGYLSDSATITTDGSNAEGETGITADTTGAQVSVTGIPAQTAFDNKGTTFGNSEITFDIGKNSTRTLPIPMRDLTHLQGSAVRRYEQLIT